MREFRDTDPFYVVGNKAHWFLQGRVVQRGEFDQWDPHCANVKMFWVKDYTDRSICDGIYMIREDDLEGPLTEMEVLGHLAKGEL